MSNVRRLIACILVGLGALLLAAAVMIPTYTVDKVAKTPLDLRITTVAERARRGKPCAGLEVAHRDRGRGHGEHQRAARFAALPDGRGALGRRGDDRPGRSDPASSTGIPRRACSPLRSTASPSTASPARRSTPRPTVRSPSPPTPSRAPRSPSSSSAAACSTASRSAPRRSRTRTSTSTPAPPTTSISSRSRRSTACRSTTSARTSR